MVVGKLEAHTGFGDVGGMKSIILKWILGNV
jgi:hypothetical protein